MKKIEAMALLKEAEEHFERGKFLKAIQKYKIVIRWMLVVIEELSK